MDAWRRQATAFVAEHSLLGAEARRSLVANGLAGANLVLLTNRSSARAVSAEAAGSYYRRGKRPLYRALNAGTFVEDLARRRWIS